MASTATAPRSDALLPTLESPATVGRIGPPISLGTDLARLTSPPHRYPDSNFSPQDQAIIQLNNLRNETLTQSHALIGFLARHPNLIVELTPASAERLVQVLSAAAGRFRDVVGTTILMAARAALDPDTREVNTLLNLMAEDLRNIRESVSTIESAAKSGAITGSTLAERKLDIWWKRGSFLADSTRYGALLDGCTLGLSTHSINLYGHLLPKPPKFADTKLASVVTKLSELTQIAARFEELSGFCKTHSSEFHLTRFESAHAVLEHLPKLGGAKLVEAILSQVETLAVTASRLDEQRDALPFARCNRQGQLGILIAARKLIEETVEAGADRAVIQEFIRAIDLSQITQSADGKMSLGAVIANGKNRDSKYAVCESSSLSEFLTGLAVLLREHVVEQK